MGLVIPATLGGIHTVGTKPSGLWTNYMKEGVASWWGEPEGSDVGGHWW